MTSRNQEAKPCSIPLDKLKKSPDNVRQVPHKKAHIQALADSIEAQGQIQNLVVKTEIEDGKPTGFYLVTAGEGRRLAQLVRVKRKKIKGDAPISCVIDDTHSAQAVSLAENDIRESMLGSVGNLSCVLPDCHEGVGAFRRGWRLLTSCMSRVCPPRRTDGAHRESAGGLSGDPGQFPDPRFGGNVDH